MLDRTHRFHGLGSLRYAYARGQTVRDARCSLKYAPNQRRQTWRAAVVVSRKVHKSAVVRNRIRRRVYEIVRTQAAPHITAAFDIIFIIYSDQLATMPAADVQTLVLGQLRQAGITAKGEK